MENQVKTNEKQLHGKKGTGERGMPYLKEKFEERPRGDQSGLIV